MNSNFNRAMLSLARDLRGMTQTELAERSQLTQGTISKYQAGSSTPSDEDIEKLAEALGFPVSFLYRTGKRHGTLDGHIFHRKKTKASSADVRRIDGHLELFGMQTGDLLHELELEFPYHIPQIDVDEYGSAELVAEAVRSHWRIPRGPIDNLTERLEAAGCFVFMFDFKTDDIDENVQWVAPNPPIILANNYFPGDRLRFSLAHALGHLVMHQDEIPHRKREDEANEFASAFLMPAEDIREYLIPVTLEHLFEIKPYWKVSVASMIMRAHQIGEISDSRKQSLFQMMSRAKWRKSEPDPIPREKPQLIYDLIRTYREVLSYKDKDLAAKLTVFPTEFRQLYYPDAPILKII